MEKQILHGSTGLCFICREMLRAGQYYLPGNVPRRQYYLPGNVPRWQFYLPENALCRLSKAGNPDEFIVSFSLPRRRRC